MSICRCRFFHGRQAGPTLLLSAALHGDELNGIEIIRRLLAMPVMKRLQGTVIAAPVVNVYGFIARSRYLPDRRDLNRSFPGSPRGSLAARLARLFIKELFSQANYAIDYHTGAMHRSNLPQIRAFLNSTEIRQLALAFAAPAVIDHKPVKGTLRRVAIDRGIPMLLYEGGEALRFDERAIRAGVKGTLGVMRALHMLPSTAARQVSTGTSLVASDSSWIRAPRSGILHATKALGERVLNDDILGFISDPFGQDEREVRSRFAGMVIGKARLPLVNEGDALFHIARE